MGVAPSGGEAESEEWFPLMESPLISRGNQLRQKERFRGLSESASAGLWQAGRVRPTQMVHAQPCIPPT